MPLRLLDFVDIHITVHHGIDGERRNALDTQFFLDILAVGNHGGGTDEELFSYLLVDFAFCHQLEYLDFPV